MFIFQDPDHITEADLKPEFVNIQTLTKGQVFVSMNNFDLLNIKITIEMS